MKLAHKVRGGSIPRLQPCVFVFAIMMMAMPAFADEVILGKHIQVSPEIFLSVSEATKGIDLVYMGKDGLKVTISSSWQMAAEGSCDPTIPSVMGVRPRRWSRLRSQKTWF